MTATTIKTRLKERIPLTVSISLQFIFMMSVKKMISIPIFVIVS